MKKYEDPNMYCSRTFISPDTHSSGYIMCYYNPLCRNEDLKCFIRLSDCARGYDFFEYNLTDFRVMFRFINKMKLLLTGKIKGFVSNGDNYYIKQIKNEPQYKHFRIVRKYKNKDFELIKKSGFKNVKKEKIMVNIHMDPDTCNSKQWNRKLKIMYNEICRFEKHLKQIQCNNKN